MTGTKQLIGRLLCVVASAVALLAAGCATTPKNTVVLTGAQEVPAVTTNASGTSDLAITLSRCPSAGSNYDCPTVSGTVVTTGIVATAAHIHSGAAGQNGPVVVPLVKQSDNVWAVPMATTVNNDIYRAFWVGGLYVNVHSAANPGGEIRAQLRP
jgi:hypothetical protein